MNNSAQVADIVTILVILVIVIISSVVGYVVLQKYNSATTNIWSNQNVSADTISKGGESFGVLDKAMLILVGGLFAGLVLSAFYVQTHPAFFIMFLLGFMIVILVVPQLSNLLTDFENDSAITSEVNVTENLPFTSHISAELPTILAVGGIIFIIALFAKPLLQRGAV